ncbi:tetratricopeptide repeat protein [Tautonia sociabilis]|uniref:Tetratricopeptide repeat protein n=1 Tax=Tautonia sociabilis TaxID=2080755 RepID=A0A432MPW7_9BACT|nr:tetratricopeptide repeat protein [Tautonia sociabilis]RUL89197.1 tetratricopeptide repeat protein [Tautonia sociabilis]
MAPARSRPQLNKKVAVGTLVVVAVVIGVGLLAGGAFQGRMRAQVLKQADALAGRGEASLAMQHLERFLRDHPDDVAVLDRYATLLSEAVLDRQEGGRIERAIQANERVLQLDPEGQVASDPQRNRRWLAELYILQSDLNRQNYGERNLQLADEMVAMESRYRAAQQVLDELIERGADDAEAYRLLGRAWEGVAGGNQPQLLKDQAVGAYSAALQRDPTDKESAARLARIYRDRLERPEEAEAVLAALVDASPDDPQVHLILHDFYAEDDPARAAEALERALELAPDDPEVILADARAAFNRGDREAARAGLDRLPEALRRRSDIDLFLATLDLQDRKTEGAIARLREGLKNASGADPTLVWSLANALIDSGNLAEARPLVERFKGLAGAEAESGYHFLRGRWFQQAGELNRAIEEFDAAEDGLDDRLMADLLVARGRCRLALNGNDPQVRFQVKEDLRVAVGIDPTSVEARLALVEQLAAEDIDQALTTIREGIAAVPSSLELRLAQLQLLMALQARQPAGRRSWAVFDAALEEARRVPTIGPDHPALITLDVRRQLLEGRIDPALAQLERAVAAHPDARALWVTWAETLTRAGRREEALAVLERASAPEAAGDSAIFRVDRARLLAQLGRGREAIEVLEEGARSLPIGERGTVLQALGRMQAARGQFAEARASYTAWKALQPGSAVPLLALLELAIDTGDRAAADRALAELRGGQEEPGLPYLLGKAEYLLRMPGGDPAGRAREALAALEPLLAPGSATANLPAALLLRGLALRELGLAEPDAQVARESFSAAKQDLRTAWERGETKAAPAMVDVMARLGQFEEIDALPRLSSGAFDVGIDRLAAEACLRLGMTEKAAEYVDRAGQLAADTPEFASWRLGMLDRLGESSQVEQALLAQARSQGQAAAWVVLIRYQAAKGDRAAALASIAEMTRSVRVDPPELLEAQALQAIGDFPRAEAAFAAALEKKPDDPQVLLAAAQFDQAAGRLRRALEHTERALAAVPDSRPAARFRALLMAELATDLPSWQASYDALGPEPPSGDTEGPEDRLARALVLARHPEPARRDEAVSRLEALVGDQPSGNPLAAAARETLARLLLQQGRAERAAEVAAVTALTGSNPSAIALYAQALVAAGQVDEAARQVDRLRNVDPDADALTDLELALVEAQAEAGSRAEELEAAYRAALDRPDAAETAAATFRRLVQLGDPAAQVAERVGRDLADRFPSLAWLPAQWLADREWFDAALDLAEAVLPSGDEDAAFQASRAALTVIERSEADPKYLDRAGALIERVAELGNPPLPASRAVLAMLRHFQGRTDPSRFQDEIRLYRELLQREPNNIIYLNNLAWAVAEIEGEPLEGLRLIDQAIEALGTRLPELLDTRGVILERLGRHEEAVADLEEVTRAQPNRALYHFHLARAQQAAGDPEAARSSMARALELGLTADDVEPTEREEFERLKTL